MFGVFEMSMHHFNVKMATEIGINASVIFEYLSIQCQKKENNDEYFYDGKVWFKGSIEFLNKLFPYMTRHSITKSLQNLKNHGYIIARNSIGVCDRTKWYSVTEMGYSIIDTFSKRG